MSQVSILESPYEVAFSRNPVVFKFKVNPFTEAEINSRLRVQVEVYMESTGWAGDYKQIWSGFTYPNNQGIAEIDLQTVLDAQLTFYTPPLKYNQFFKCTGQYAGYYIKYFLIDNQNALTSPVIADGTLVAKGGISKEQHQGNVFFTDNIVTQKQPLHWRGEPDKLRLNERKWLYFMMPFHNSQTSEMELEITLHLATGGSITYADLIENFFLNTWEVACVPIHLDALNIYSHVAPGTVIKAVSFYIFGDQYDVATYRYEVDHRPIQDVDNLYYRNSLGGIENQPVLGLKEYNTDVEKRSQSTSQQAQWLNGIKIQSQQADFWSAETPSTKGNTGFLNIKQLKRLRDMLLNHEVFQILNKRIRPLYINTKQASLYSNKEKLHNLEIEYQPAYNDRNFTADDTIAFNDSCPAVEFFQATQKVAMHVSCEWKLPAGYNLIQISILKSGNWTDYNLQGNNGSADIKIHTNWTWNTNIPISIKARVICNTRGAGDYGPYTNVTVLSIKSELNPVAVDDIADVGARAFSPRILQLNNNKLQLLANDITSNLGIGTLGFLSFCNSLGGFSSISKNGAGLSYNNITKEVTYSPTAGSLATLTQDEFWYRIFENFPGNSLTSNIAKVIVPLSGQIPPVYVRRVRSNERKQQFGYGIFNAYKMDEVIADYHLKFYSDAALTTPVDVTGFGLVIAWTDDIEVIDMNSLGVVVNTTNSTGGPYTINAIGTSMLFRKNYYDRKWNGATDEITDKHTDAAPTSGTGNWIPIGW